MKNLYKLIGIIALVAVIGFSFTACGDDDDDNGGGGGGTFTLTNIPSEYNGKYMHITFEDDAGGLFYGNMESDLPTTFVLSISNGRASIPLWEGADDGVGFQRYTRTVTASCECDILGSKFGSPLIHFEFYSISFKNGNATKSWNDIDKFGY